MGQVMPEVCFVYDDGTKEIIRLSQHAFEQAQREALMRGIKMEVVIKEMADELREDIERSHF